MGGVGVVLGLGVVDEETVCFGVLSYFGDDGVEVHSRLLVGLDE
jgi:hypothetical protein